MLVNGLRKMIIYDRLFADYDRLLQYIGKSKKIRLVKMKAVTAGVIFAVPDARFAERQEQQIFEGWRVILFFAFFSENCPCSEKKIVLGSFCGYLVFISLIFNVLCSSRNFPVSPSR